MWLVTVDADKCEGCEECVNNCPVAVFKMEDGKADHLSGRHYARVVRTCVSVCPTENSYS